MNFVLLTVAGTLASFSKLFLALLTIRIYLTWFPNINFYVQPFLTLGKMTDPYLRLFRGLIPPVFNIDFSPILAFLFITFVEDFFSNIATTIVH
nr:Ycf19 [Ochrosphaera neapolitana]